MQTNNGMTVVLNGGKDVLESATIPVQWFFSREVAEQAPTHILIIDYAGDEFKTDRERSCDHGIRYVVKVTDTVKFLQMFRPGIHHLCFVAFKPNEGKEKKIGQYFLTKDGYCYDTSVTVDDAGFIRLRDNRYVTSGNMATAYAKIDIPDGFFAKIPES